MIVKFLQKLQDNKTLILALIISIAILMTVIFSLSVDRADAFAYVEQNLSILQKYSNSNPYQAMVLYIFAYALLAISCIPGMFIATTIGGALFGFINGSILTAIGTTLGSFFSFWLCRKFFRQEIETKFLNKVEMLNKKMQQGEFYYFLSLRLFIVFPYYIVNILASVTKVRPFTFIATTFLGMIPVHCFYSYIGASLKQFISGKMELNPQIFIVVFLSAAVVFFFPQFLKYFRREEA